MNDIVFDNAIPRDILARAQLQMHEEITKEIKSICRSLEATMIEICVPWVEIHCLLVCVS
jgi:hypothetical protein